MITDIGGLNFGKWQIFTGLCINSGNNLEELVKCLNYLLQRLTIRIIQVIFEFRGEFKKVKTEISAADSAAGTPGAKGFVSSG